MGIAEDLQNEGAYASPAPEAVELIQTHISWVFRTGTEVFKVKKPVDFGFLDFRTLEQRRVACEAEVRLNARLTPRVYAGVVAVHRDAGGRHNLRGEGEIVDYAVRMRQLADEDCAERRLADGRLSGEDVDRLAAHLARFHERCRHDAEVAKLGRVETVAFNVEENFAQARGSIATYLTADEAKEVAAWQRGFLARSSALLDARAAAGRVRDGHGDLRLEHVYLRDDGGFDIIDCIEFNDRFRHADVCADLAFLSMDLAWHGRVDLAERLLAKYARESDDFDLYDVADFYESYRAFVRGKIATFVANDEAAGDEVRSRAGREARRYLLLALAACRKSLLPPVLVAVGGLIASGKSTVSDRLGGRMSAPVVDADRTRKHMLGVEALRFVGEPAWKGAYDPAFTEKVYAEVLRRAEVVVRSGRSVLIDASFRSPSMRGSARAVALRCGVPFKLIECRAPDEVCRERARLRQMGASVSDGRLEIWDDFKKRYEPPDEIAPSEHIVVDTTRSLEAMESDLEGVLPLWPLKPMP